MGKAITCYPTPPIAPTNVFFIFFVRIDIRISTSNINPINSNIPEQKQKFDRRIDSCRFHYTTCLYMMCHLEVDANTEHFLTTFIRIRMDKPINRVNEESSLIHNAKESE